MPASGGYCMQNLANLVATSSASAWGIAERYRLLNDGPQSLVARQTVSRRFGPINRPPIFLYSRKMEWGQLSIFFAVACFAAIALFMISR